jgi:hypothetical protein
MPLPIASRRITHLSKIEKEPELIGKGPFLLCINHPLDHIWQEDDPRKKVTYELELTAKTKVALTLSNGMEAEITDQNSQTIAKTSKGSWQGELTHGPYRILAESVEKNNRLPYQISLTTTDLIPGTTYTVGHMPEKFIIPISEPGLIEIETFGSTDVKAMLTDASGMHTLAVNDDRPHDWNPAISLNVLPGTYQLILQQVGTTFNPFQVALSQRQIKSLANQSLPFTIKEALAENVWQIFFHTGESQHLYHILSNSAQPVEFALYYQQQLLAANRNEIFIPLPANQDYQLMAWSQPIQAAEDALAEISVKSMTVGRLKLNAENPSFRAEGALHIENADQSCFLIEGKDKASLFFTPAVHQSALPLNQYPLNTQEQSGWLIAKEPQTIEIKKIIIKNDQPSYFQLSNIPLTVPIRQTQDHPALIRISSIHSLIGGCLFPQSSTSQPAITWQENFMSPGLTMFPLPGKGNYQSVCWNTVRLPHITSPANRRLGSDQISMAITTYPLEKTIPLSENNITISDTVLAQKSMRIILRQPDQAVDLLLCTGMAAFSENSNQVQQFFYSHGQNQAVTFHPGGKSVTIINTNPTDTLFRLSGSRPFAQTASLVLTDRLEMINGEVSDISVPAIPDQKKLYALGKNVRAELYSAAGIIDSGQPLSSDIPGIVFSETAGKLKIRSYEGCLCLLIAKPAQIIDELFPNHAHWPKTAWSSQSILMDTEPQQITIQLDQAACLKISQPAVALLGLFSAEHMLNLILGDTALAKESILFLKPGDYQLKIRPIQGTSAAGNVETFILHPQPITANTLNQTHIIGQHEEQIFSFTLPEKRKIGIGIQAQADELSGELFNDQSARIDHGPLIIRTLPPGNYLYLVKSKQSAQMYKLVLLGLFEDNRKIPDDIIESYQQGGTE